MDLHSYGRGRWFVPSIAHSGKDCILQEKLSYARKNRIPLDPFYTSGTASFSVQLISRLEQYLAVYPPDISSGDMPP